ncbi:MAG TPA: KGG domain-containing protein [Candidatus Saccharimonadales bacterium]|nr:KGG domain-containing protein [Candidatus Saccharimonadales bacterium]
MAHKNPGNFANNRARAQAAGRKGGSVSPGNFKFDPARASRAGRKGGLK